MKTFTLAGAIIFSAMSLTAWSQEGDKKEQELDKVQESKRARSTQGLRTENELKDDRGDLPSNQYRQSPADSASVEQGEQSSEGEVIPRNEDQGLGNDDDGNGLTNDNNTTQDGEQRNNTPAVIQRTSSASGTPALPSGDNGTDRDGTNNVQRARPNIAGAEVPGNMNLSEKNVGERNRNTGAEQKIREQEHQPNASPDKKEQQSDQAKVAAQQKQDAQSGELKETSSTGKEPETAAPAPEDKKTKRKNRRNRKKDN